MSTIKKLASQTAVYGLSSIVGRFLNFLLVPIYTRVFKPEEYGIVTDLYSVVAFLVVLLTLGMETGFFRYSNKKEVRDDVFSASVTPIAFINSLFVALMLVFSEEIASAMKYPGHGEYITWFALILAFDSLSAIPMAKLRAENKPGFFALVNLINIGINLGLNLFFIVYCPKAEPNWLTELVYTKEIGVGYIFISNLIASGVKTLMLSKKLLAYRPTFSRKMLWEMLMYSLPLMVASFAGVINETLDRAILKNLLIPIVGEDKAFAELGIYGACYKVSVLITLFIQAYRYAAEPFFFSKAKDQDAKESYAKIMNMFVAVCVGILMMTMLFLDQAMQLIGPEFRVGRDVVPILLVANTLLGIYYNQSIWYKLSDRTRMGALIGGIGALITIVLNLVLVPVMSYHGAAWATLACYGSMVVISWALGQKYYPIPYNLGRIFLYLLMGVAVIGLNYVLPGDMAYLRYIVGPVILMVYGLGVLKLEGIRLSTLRK